mmetsp:Transcript_52139/g.92945  ORF Transcript_52139/g.92945 Transcript_52139/m.92945 type:complete len:373 (+) Transcript_52139:1179-2297(+)
MLVSRLKPAMCENRMLTFLQGSAIGFSPAFSRAQMLAGRMNASRLSVSSRFFLASLSSTVMTPVSRYVLMEGTVEMTCLGMRPSRDLVACSAATTEAMMGMMRMTYSVMMKPTTPTETKMKTYVPTPSHVSASLMYSAYESAKACIRLSYSHHIRYRLPTASCREGRSVFRASTCSSLIHRFIFSLSPPVLNVSWAWCVAPTVLLWPSAVVSPKYSWRRFVRSRTRSWSSACRSASNTVVSCHTTACPRYKARTSIHSRSEATISVEGYTPETVMCTMPKPKVRIIRSNADTIAMRNRIVLWPSDKMLSLSMAPAFKSRILLVRKATIPRDMQMKMMVATMSTRDMMVRSTSLSAIDCIARLSMLPTICDTT